jgi:membrane fusion protein (multidrug efflux system)
MKMRHKSIVFFLVVFLFLLTAACDKAEKKAPQAPPPSEVTVYETRAEDVPIYKVFVGQTYGAKDIAIRARVEGFLKGIHFKEGSEVKAGDLLYIIESQPFEAEVASKQGLLAEANTELVKAKRDLERYRPLAEQKAVSQSDLDGAIAAYDAAQASVEAAQANVRAAEIQMGYTRIYSPINGIIGKTEAKVGDFVGRDPNPVILNMVSNTDSVLVEFFLTETQYLGLARHIAEVGIQAIKEDERKSDIQLILADGQLYSHKGRPNFIDRKIDPTTGAILVQVSFPNPQNIIRPGQFAKIKARVDNVKDGILIPQRCVSDLQGRKRVFIVDDQNMVHERPVTLGPTIDNFWLVTDGLKPDEKIIYEGLQKVADGTKVKPTVTDVERITQEDE